MRSDLDPTKKAVYEAAQRFVDVALLKDGSMFVPDRAVWSASCLEDLYTRFNLSPDLSSDSFEEKFARQLDGAPTATIQLAAEVVFVHFLAAADIGAAAKRHLINVIRSWTPEEIAIPDDLQAAFETGMSGTGVAFKTSRPNQLWFLIDAVRAWKALDAGQQTDLLGDPWRFKAFVEKVPQTAAYTQRQALLHLLFPSAFEDMVSRDQKKLIIQAFAPDMAEPLLSDPDRALTAIRAKLSSEREPGFAFWESPLVERWRPAPKRPLRPDSDGTTNRRAWLLRGTEDGKSLIPDWLEGGYCSIGWSLSGDLPLDIDRAALVERLRVVYPDAEDGTLRTWAGIILRFLQSMQVGDIVLAPDGSDLYVGVVEGDVEYRPGGIHFWRREVEWANPDHPISRSDVSQELYSKLRTLLTLTDITEARGELESYLESADRPTVQPRPVARRASALLPDATPELAASLHVSQEWLQEQIELLRRKQQLVLYGPPGTGKTYLAQALADHLAGDPSASVLVQFHPSFSYEDFFEGFRPRPTAAGLVGFELVPGPLRRLADAAANDRERPYVLIIDELNRANLAKVFGELYFLLEYRERAISLQYSAETQFQLPQNLYVIGTMNTVDRSIALVDSAMRRRFYFTPLLPDRPPVSQLLGSWLKARGLPGEIASIHAELNRRIGDPEVAIGPSYFMQPDIGDPRVLTLVWEHAIIPLLQEHHFGTDVDVESLYSLDSVRHASTVALGGTETGGEIEV